MNSGNITFMLFSTALVMLMTPALALFYGGLVRSKSVLSTILQSFVCLGVVSLLWVFFGYSLSFGTDFKGIIGGFDYVFLNNVGFEEKGEIPHLLFCAFQMMFAVITPALITGAFAERIKFASFLIFISLWTIFVYFPVCHSVWGGGFISKLGALDFAGGAVIHINSGAAALATSIFIGKRKGFGKTQFLPHNLTLVIIGAGILWFGWFGFNAGSSLAVNNITILSFFNTHIAAASASLSWLFYEWKKTGKPTILGFISGALSGLVAITPAAGFVSIPSSIIIGIIAGVLSCAALRLKTKFQFDDALDVVAIHGVGGVFGAIATGVFASLKVNPNGANGLIFGETKLFFVQIISVIIVIIFSITMTFIILKITNLISKVRVENDEEIQGLDISQHNEVAYEMK